MYSGNATEVELICAESGEEPVKYSPATKNSNAHRSDRHKVGRRTLKTKRHKKRKCIQKFIGRWN